MIGRDRVNLEPFLFSDWTFISPPSAMAIFLLTARPSPTPSLFSYLLLLILVKGVNKRFSYSWDIPTPESSTLMYIVEIS